MRTNHALLLLGIVAVVAGLAMAAVPGVQAQEGGGMDHSGFPPLQGPFESGQEVTAACLTCHRAVADEIMGTTHWTWQFENPITGELLGKANVVNNYCISTRTNEPRCTSCHIGYGWRDDTFDFAEATNIDCLVCHDTTGTYKKFPTAAGNPVLGEPVEFGGATWEPVDLALVAQNVGPTSRETCGACHFTGGGADGVKHGDLDTTMIDPAFEQDVHMSPDGLDFTCTACHVTEAHDIAGGRYVMETFTGGQSSCESCHTAAPHEGNDMLNQHASTVACQTCHIPAFARGEPTMMTWDWSKAGETNPDGGGVWLRFDEETGVEVYDTRKGEFTWAENVVPEYRWFSGTFDYTLPAETIDPETGFVVNAIQGSREDENARIWPFKMFTGVQPYDSVNNLIAPMHLFPTSPEDSTAFWKAYDWGLAIADGMAAYGLEYSGEYGFINSVMYWPITHQVAPAENALICTDCHAETGRLDWVALGYTAEEAAGLSAFPPSLSAAEEPTPEPTPEPAIVEEPTEEPAPEPTEEVAELTEGELIVEEVLEAESVADLVTISAPDMRIGWLVVIGIAIVSGAIYYFVSRQRKGL